MPIDGVETYREVNQFDKKFILLGEAQDVIEDTCDATFVELRPDEYHKKED